MDDQELRNELLKVFDKVYYQEKGTYIDCMVAAYNLGKERENNYIKSLQIEINRAGNIAMDLRGKLYKFHWEDNLIQDANKIVNILSQIATDRYGLTPVNKNETTP